MATGTDMIGAGEAAKELGVTPRQVRNLIVDGTLPARKVGRDYVIERADLAKVARKRRRGWDLRGRRKRGSYHKGATHATAERRAPAPDEAGKPPE